MLWYGACLLRTWMLKPIEQGGTSIVFQFSTDQQTFAEDLDAQDWTDEFVME